MEKETKDLLNGIFDARDQAAATKETDDAEQTVRDEAALKLFSTARDEIIIPAMQTIAEYLKERGIPCAVGSGEDRYHATDRRDMPASVTLLMSRSKVAPRYAPHAHGQAGPFFQATFNKKTGVVMFSHCLSTTTIKDSHAHPAGEMAVGDLTQAKVEAKIADTVLKIYS